MRNYILEQLANEMEHSECPMPLRLVLREVLRVYHTPRHATAKDIRKIEVPPSFFDYMASCGTNVYVGKCIKGNKDTVRHICAKINRKVEKREKTVGITVSDAKSFDGKWSLYPNVISSVRFETIARMFLGISFETLYMSALELLSQSYSSICVFLTNGLSEKLYRELREFDGICVTAVTPKDIVNTGVALDWLKFALKKRPEIFISSELCMGQTHIYDGEVELFHIPFHDMFGGSGFMFENEICINIIPKLEKHNVKVMVVQNPQPLRKKVKFRHTQYEDISENLSGEKLIEVKRFLGKHCDDILDARENGSVCLHHHIPVTADYQNASVHWASGERYTEGNRYSEKKSIYFFGPCIVSGFFVSDGETIPSFLRKMDKDMDYVVHNLGANWTWMGWSLRTQTYRNGDIVIIFANDSKTYERHGIKMIDISKAYYDLKSDLPKCLWGDSLHCNAYVNRNIAELLYKEMKKRGWFETQSVEGGEYFRLTTDRKKNNRGGGTKHPELEEWLCRHKDCLAQGLIGAVCMNCNPMTNGHLYLIETAAQSVDFLYVFILEEDRSAFCFEDRIRLVRDAVAYLPNVSVVPSGRFIISTSTLPGYFNKKNLQKTVVDSTYDLTLFAEYIAPELGIRVRFAGEEPLDKFTAQYNYNMRKILPLYGIEFVEIPRKMQGSDVISASRVRELTRQNQWKEIKRIVPDNVYRFLKCMKRTM